MRITTAGIQGRIARLTLTALLYWLALLVVSVSNQALLLPLLIGAGLPLFGWGVLRLAGAGFLHPDDLAFRDDLTGLGNRRAFHRRAESLLRHAGPGSLALVLLDVDDLKTLNDGCGHQAGDELLVTFAHSLRDAFPGNDAVFRIGGDEFAILVDRSNGGSVTSVVERIQPFVARFRTCDHEHLVAASHGFASSGTDETFDGLFRRADARLRDYKRLLYEGGERPDRRRQVAAAASFGSSRFAADEDAANAANIASLDERRRRHNERRA